MNFREKSKMMITKELIAKTWRKRALRAESKLILIEKLANKKHYLLSQDILDILKDK